MVNGKGTSLRPVNRKGWFKPYISSTWPLYLMMLVPIIYIICFKYKPMLGIVMAFKKYTPFGGRSMWEMDWVGFKWFQEAFQDSLFWKSVANTLVLNLGDLILGFPFPIILAIFLNELRNDRIRKTTQLSLYLPNFLSWVIISGITAQVFAASGLLNNIINALGGAAVPFLSDTVLWRFVYWIWPR